MSGQQQLHQLVEKEAELSAAWQVALDKSEKDLRDYNDSQQEGVESLSTSPGLVSEIKKILEKGKKDEQLITKKYQEGLGKELSNLDDHYRQRELLLTKKMMENFKNKYIN